MHRGSSGASRCWWSLGADDTASSRVRSSDSGTSTGSTEMPFGWGRSDTGAKTDRNRRVPETRGERKLVTLLFTDLTGYTALAASLDPEEVFSFIRPTLADLQRVVEDHGGTVPQVQGDGFMAVFGVPVAHEDDAERAVRAALAVRERIRELNEGRSGLSIPEVHSGVNSGEVMVGPAAEASGIAVVGDVVNTASRLADLAPGGTVLVEERTWRRTRHAIRYGRRGSYTAKGKSEPVVAYEARAPRTSFPAGRASPLVGAEFVDREAHLERLSAEFRAVRKDRRARVVIVSGEAGAGKTRLASEFIKRHPDALVLAGRSTAYGTQVALSPLASAIGEIAGVTPGSATPSGRRRIQALAERVATGDDARRVTRGLSLLFGLDERGEGRGSRGTADALDAAQAVLEGLARERPVVVLLDDLHWADPAIVDALGSFRSHPWSGPLLMVGITRSESLHRLKAQTRVELDAIPDDAMGELASLALGRKAFTPALRSVVTRAGGNPLFLEESLSMLVEAGGLVSTASGWVVADPQMLERVPTTVRAMIAARLDGLPPDEKWVLQCASVSGELTWDRLLERLAPGIDVPRVLRSMVSRDLLRRRRGSQAKGSNEFIFKHALIRDVAYGSLPRGERARLHVDVAGWLLDDANMPREPVDDLAIHYAEAWRLSRSMSAARAPEGLARSAALYLGRWAEETMARQALLAESLYARALEVGDEAPGEVDPELRARHAIGRAECLIELGRHQEAREAATYALQLADGLNDEQLGARALVAWGRVESDTGDDDLAGDLLGRALASFESVGDVSGQAWATHRLSEIATKTDYASALEHLRRAHGLFVEAGDRWGQAIAAQDLAYMLSTIGGDGVPRSVSRGEATRRGRRRSSFPRRAASDARVLPLLLRRARRRHRDHAGGAPDRDRRGGSLRRGGLAADRGARLGRDAHSEGGRTGVSSGRGVRPADPLGPRAVAGKSRGCAGHPAFGRPARRRAASGVISSSPRAVGSADGDARGRPVGRGDVPRSGSLGSGSRAGGGGSGGRARERRATRSNRSVRCLSAVRRSARESCPTRPRLWARPSRWRVSRERPARSRWRARRSTRRCSCRVDALERVVRWARASCWTPSRPRTTGWRR